MKKILFTISFFTFTLFKSFSQTSDTLLCDAPDRDTTEAELLPWFGNNNFITLNEKQCSIIGHCFSFIILTENPGIILFGEVGGLKH